MSIYIEKDTFALAYQMLLTMCLRSPDFTSRPRGMEVRELLSPTIRVRNPLSRFYETSARSTPMRYAAGEFLWYFGLRNDAEFITKYSSFWNQLKNQTNHGPLNEGKLNSSYGELTMGSNWLDAAWDDRWVTQWEWALNSMARDNDTRQAIMHVNRPSHQVSWIRDFPCTILFQFILRGYALHMVVTMRSNDLIKGLTFDFPMFSFFQEQFRYDIELLIGHPISMGTLTLTAASSHIYERDFDIVSQMIGEGVREHGPVEMLRQPPFVGPIASRSHSKEFTDLMSYAEHRMEISELSPVYDAFKRAL